MLGFPDLEYEYSGLLIKGGIDSMVSAKLGCEGSGSDGVTNEKLLGGGLEEDQKFTFWGMNITFGR